MVECTKSAQIYIKGTECANIYILPQEKQGGGKSFTVQENELTSSYMCNFVVGVKLCCPVLWHIPGAHSQLCTQAQQQYKLCNGLRILHSGWLPKGTY